MFDTMKRKYQSWKKYRSTYSELSRLSTAELNDLGIARGEIEQLSRSVARVEMS